MNEETLNETVNEIGSTVSRLAVQMERMDRNMERMDRNMERMDRKMDENTENMDRKIGYMNLLGIIFAISFFVSLFFMISALYGDKKFYRERLNVLEKATSAMQFPGCNDMVTFFGASYAGYSTDVTVSHVFCINGSSELLPCHGVDVALTRSCPRQSFALRLVDNRYLIGLGDPVVAYGYASYLNSWTGHLGGVFGKDEVNFPPFMDKANWPRDTFVVTGDQDKGMSGAPVLNSYGLVGLASGVLPGSFSTHRQVGVIPSHHILRCIRQYGKMGMLKTTQQCKELGTTEVSPPWFLSVYDIIFRLLEIAKRSLSAMITRSDDAAMEL